MASRGRADGLPPAPAPGDPPAAPRGSRRVSGESPTFRAYAGGRGRSRSHRQRQELQKVIAGISYLLLNLSYAIAYGQTQRPSWSPARTIPARLRKGMDRLLPRQQSLTSICSAGETCGKASVRAAGAYRTDPAAAGRIFGGKVLTAIPVRSEGRYRPCEPQTGPASPFGISSVPLSARLTSGKREKRWSSCLSF